MENIHSEMYSLLIDTYIKDSDERSVKQVLKLITNHKVNYKFACITIPQHFLAKCLPVLLALSAQLFIYIISDEITQWAWIFLDLLYY